MRFMKIAIAVLTLLLVGSVAAAELKNNDDTAYTIRVVTDEDSTEVVIQPGATITEICDECVLYMDGSDEPFDVYEGDNIVIKDGAFEANDE